MKNINIFSLVTEYKNAKSGGVLNVTNVFFVDEDSSVRYLLKNIDPYNGHEYVDLGLSVKWATCNIGASSPEQSGLYFAWGETTGYTGEQVENGERVFDKASYNAGPAASISADLTLEQDAAHVHMGGKWRMPTKDECQELLDNCNVVWTKDYNRTGMTGRVFTSKVNGNSVFFPAAGFCADSSVRSVGINGNYFLASLYSSTNIWELHLSAGMKSLDQFGTRYYGFSVRGVCE